MTSKDVAASVSSVLSLLRAWDCTALRMLFHPSFGAQERLVIVLLPKPVRSGNGFSREDRSVKYFGKAIKRQPPPLMSREGGAWWLSRALFSPMGCLFAGAPPSPQDWYLRHELH